MTVEKYDTIGKTYTATRQADLRIIDRIIDLLHLPLGANVVDVGAGTGNYTLELVKYGYQVTAVEPSFIMRQQGKTHPRLNWMDGTAEDLPFHDNAVDGVVCTLAVHHFTHVEQSFKEMIRIVRTGNPIVLFVSDPRQSAKDNWLTDYFVPIFNQSFQVYPILEELVAALERTSGHQVMVETFRLPPDLTDRFFMSGWRHPEWYLDPMFRKGVSPLANASMEVVDRCVKRLEEDLKSGAWHEKYGDILSQTEFDGGYRFLVARS
jgi:ubiquinone/menaquinone biosynthesis C-methylase UbiE